MVRLALLAALAAAVPACFLAEEDDIDDLGDDNGEECGFNVCVTKDNPFRFAVIPRFGVATQVPVQFMAHHSLHGNFEIVANDPSIELVPESGGLVMRAHQAGTFVLTARNTLTQTDLAHMQFDTADVASIGFTLRVAPVAPEPLTSLAALVGGTDSVGLAFRDGNGMELAGSAPVAVGDPAIVKVQLADWFVLDGPVTRTRIGLVGLETGTTQVTLTMFDGRTATLPIEVVDTVATLEVVLVKFDTHDHIVAVTGPVTPSDVVYAGLVAKTSDARVIAGVYAAWDAIGPVELFRALGYPTTPEVQAIPKAQGSAEIIATTGGMTASATLDVH